MNVLIVYAHNEPKSFNGAMKDLAIKTLTEQGHKVEVSDLYAMKFNAVATGADFNDRFDNDFLKYQKEQEHAMTNKSLSFDIRIEMKKLEWADFVIFQFPVWWFSMPAILKGWIDRVFAAGFVYGGGKWYDKGGLKGKKAMLSITTGGPQNIYEPNGINGDIDMILFHIEHGMLYFAGFEVLPAYIGYAAASVTPEKREEYLEEYRQRLLTFETTKPIPFHPLSDYDFKMQLKPEFQIKM